MRGERLAEVLASWRWASGDATGTRMPPGRIHTFVELHIEQGPRLEQERTDIGVVTAITGHDSQNMAHLGPTGMIFVPSRGGRSHAADEYTSFDAIAAGADVLLATLLELARGDRP